MVKALFLFSLSITFSLPLISQSTLKGTVIDDLVGESLIGAHILYLDDLGKSATTDENGNFEIILSDDQRNGELLVSYIGFEETLVSFDLLATNEYRISLNRNEVSLRNVEIRASKSISEEFAVQQISKLDIYKNPNSRADPIRAVNSLAASTNIDESANLSLRGSPPGETAIILNNVPIEDAFRLDQSNGIGQFSIFNTSIINKVDVYPSNPPLEYGGSTSGAVVLHTDDFSGSNGQSLNITLAGIGMNLSRTINQKSSLVAYANVGIDNGLKFLNKNAFDDIKGFNTIDGGFHWTSKLSEHSKLKIFNYTLKESYDYNTSTPSYSGIFKQNKLKNLTIINYEKRWTSNMSLDVNQGFNITNANYKFGNSDHNVAQKDLFSSINFNRFGQFWTIKIGSSITANNLDNHGLYSKFYFALRPDNPSVPYNIKEWVINPEMYAYNKLRLSNKIKIGVGLRANFAPSTGIKKYLSQQVNLNYNIDASNNFKISAGKYNKVFLPGEEFEKTTNVSSEHFSIDYSYKLEKFSVTSSLYKKRATYDTHVSEIFGAEVFASYTTSKLSASLAVTHLDAKDLIHEEEIPNEYDINHFARLLLKYSINNSIELNSVVLLRSGKYYNPILGSTYHSETNSYEPDTNDFLGPLRLSPYSVWDLSLSKVSDVDNGSLITFVSCSNLLNLKNQQSIEYDEQYNNIGYHHFNSRIVFFGLVYNWQ